MGLVKRRLYKKDRKPARKKGALSKMAPISLPDASKFEITSAIAVLLHACNVIIGRGNEYDPLKDMYHLTAKSLTDNKVCDFQVRGSDVADLIKVARSLNGGRMQKRGRRN